MSGIDGISGITPDALQRAYGVGGETAAPRTEGGFAKRLGELLQEVDRLQDHSSEVNTRMLAGEATDVHEVMIAGEEAGLAFTLMIEIRNRLLEAYQELMRMQV